MNRHNSTGVFIPGCESELLVKYSYTPGCPGRMYLDNGDPGYPDEDDEVEVLSVMIGDHEIIDLLSEDTINEIADYCIEYERDYDDFMEDQ